ncbi:putative clathrin assembly protein [Hibiscus syriacus]|uniref:Clathrin assembly protein n=1 Tax=Hibiscus syriacus TaxID=106335 RepID=A0A6A2Z7J1_HIBSY|nr:putative clathrin assembly protein [Hibiscus syriacus]
MSGGGTQKSLRIALGAIKDTTTVSLAKVNSDYKELDIAIVEATNHYERPAKEKHIRAIFAAVSATRPWADVAYCIHALARRLSRTHNWAVALKTLIVIHRALRVVDPTFHEELINYGRSRSHMLNMSHFKDDSIPNGGEAGMFPHLERTKDLETAELLEQLPALQQLLFRVLSCQPQDAAVYNFVIQLALSMFFEMQRPDALRALDIYRRSGQQRLSEFYEVCKSFDVGRGERFIKIEQSPASFLQAMEEYVREAPWASTGRKDQVDKPQEVLAIEYKKTAEVQEECSPSPPALEPVKVEKVEEPIVEPPDLLGLNDPSPVASELYEKNALALAIVPVVNGTTGWELALVTAPSSNKSVAAASKLKKQPECELYNPWEPPAPIIGATMQQPAQDPFSASNMNAAPHSVQVVSMANQQQAFMLQQQPQMMMIGPQQQQSSNPFGNPYGASAHPYGPVDILRLEISGPWLVKATPIVVGKTRDRERGPTDDIRARKEDSRSQMNNVPPSLLTSLTL